MPTPNQIRLRTLSVCRDGSDFSLPKLQTLSSNGVATVRELITHELNKAKNLLVLCSEAAASSEWVRFEAEWFLANKGPDKITLAMTEGFDPSAEPERYIPDPLLKAGLGGQVWYDLRGFKKAESRKWSKVRLLEDECVQLACHLNGSTLGEIRPLYFAEQERLKRQRRRWSTVVGTLLTVFAVLAIGFGIVSVDRQRSERNAQKERDLARQTALLKDREAAGAMSDFERGRLRAIASLSRKAFDSGNCVLSMRYALAGLPPPGAPSTTLRSVELEELLIKTFSTCPILATIRGKYNNAQIMPNAEQGLFDGVEGDERWNAIWRLRDHKFIATLDTKLNRKGPNVLFSDSSKFGRVEEDNVFRVYSTKTGKVVAALKGVWKERNDGYVNDDYSFVTAISSPDGRRVALGTPRAKIRVMAVAPPGEVSELGAEGLHAYAISPDGKMLVTGTDYPQKIQVWEIGTGKELYQAASSTHQGAAIFSPDGRKIAIWGLQGAEFWRLDKNSKPIKFSEMARGANIDQNERIESILFGPHDKVALVIGQSHTYIWDLDHKKVGAKINQYLLGPAAFLPDGSTFVAGSDDPFVSMWRVADGKLIAKFPVNGKIVSIAVAADGTSFAIGTERSVAQLWDLGWMHLLNNADAIKSHACDVDLLGAHPFSSAELADPLLRGYEALASPCDYRSAKNKN